MTALVSVETVLLVLLIVLVAALLRSHAEILRRLGAEDASSRCRRRRARGCAPKRPPPTSPASHPPATRSSCRSRARARGRRCLRS